MAAQETGIVRVANESALAVAEREKIDLIKRTVAKGTTDEELRLFLYTAQRTGLDPLTKQIHAIKRWSKKENRDVMTIQTGIDGYRVVAERTGKLAGSDDPVYDTESEKHPNKATVTVYKMIEGTRCPFTASARWTEYVQTFNDGNPMGLWVKMPYLMLGKCAEALALRKAFPADLSGVYTFEEMSQADTAPAVTIEPTETITGELSEQRTQGGKTWWNVNGSLVFCDEQNTLAEYSRLLDQAGKTATVTGWFRKEHDGKKVYELAEVVKVEAPKVADESGIFEAKVISVIEKNDKKGGKFLSVWTDRKEHPLDNLSITLQCFHKSLGPALKDCIDRVCKFSVKRNGSYINIEDVLEVEGIAYKDGKIAE